ALSPIIRDLTCLLTRINPPDNLPNETDGFPQAVAVLRSALIRVHLMKAKIEEREREKSIIIAVRMGLFRSEDQGKTWQDMRVARCLPFPYGRDSKVSPQDPNTLYACLSVAASSKEGALYRSQDVGKTWQRFEKVTPHGTLMSVGLHHGDAKQVYVAARYGEVFGTQDGGESWLEMPLPQGVQHIYALACG